MRGTCFSPALRVSQLIKIPGFKVLEVLGSQELELQGMNTLTLASHNELSFIASPRYLPLLPSSKAGALLLTPEIYEKIAHDTDIVLLLVDNVWLALSGIMQYLFEPKPLEESHIHPTAQIADGVQLGKAVYIGPYAVIGRDSVVEDGTYIDSHVVIEQNCHIGKHSRLEAFSYLAPNTRLGNEVRLSPGVILGASGFKNERFETGLVRIPQVGRVVLEDKVDIGSHCTIDRSFLNETRIGYGTKIDNHVHIAHNCQIGAHCFIAAYCGIAGSVVIGEGCTLWGGVDFIDNISLGAHSTVYAGSALSRSYPEYSELFGRPAKPLTEAKKNLFYINHLPELFKKVKRLLEKDTDGGDIL